MADIKINFIGDIAEWKLTFKNGLSKMGIAYDESMLVNLCNSLNKSLIKYLVDAGYKPNITHSYRKGLYFRLKKHGLAISVKTNSILWKYLEYFTDLEDYSKCFDIKIYVKDFTKATQDIIKVNVMTDTNVECEVGPLVHSEEYTTMLGKIDTLRFLAEQKAEPETLQTMLKEITDIVEYLVKGVD